MNTMEGLMVEKKARVHLKRVEEHQIAKLLESHLTVISDGVVVYEDGWSDRRVADETQNARVSPQHVCNVRIELFGRFPEKRTLATVDLSDLKIRIERLERLVDSLVESVTRPRQ